MTLQEIKNQVAVSIGYQNWKHMNQNSTLTENEQVLDQVAERYAQSQLSEANKRIENLLNTCSVLNNLKEEYIKEAEVWKKSCDNYCSANEFSNKEIERLKDSEVSMSHKISL